MYWDEIKGGNINCSSLAEINHHLLGSYRLQFQFCATRGCFGGKTSQGRCCRMELSVTDDSAVSPSIWPTVYFPQPVTQCHLQPPSPAWNCHTHILQTLAIADTLCLNQVYWDGIEFPNVITHCLYFFFLTFLELERFALAKFQGRSCFFNKILRKCSKSNSFPIIQIIIGFVILIYLK